MCGLRTRPWTDIDPPSVSRTAIGGGSISSRRPRGDSLLTRSSAVIKRYVWPTVDELAFGLYAAVTCSERLDAITLSVVSIRSIAWELVGPPTMGLYRPASGGK